MSSIHFKRAGFLLAIRMYIIVAREDGWDGATLRTSPILEALSVSTAAKERIAGVEEYFGSKIKPLVSERRCLETCIGNREHALKDLVTHPYPPPFSSSVFNAVPEQDFRLLATSIEFQNQIAVGNQESSDEHSIKIQQAWSSRERQSVKVEIKHVPVPIELTIRTFRDVKILRVAGCPTWTLSTTPGPLGRVYRNLDESGGVDALAGQASGLRTRLMAPVSAYEFGKKLNSIWVSTTFRNSNITSRSRFMHSGNEEAAKPPPETPPHFRTASFKTSAFWFGLITVYSVMWPRRPGFFLREKILPSPPLCFSDTHRTDFDGATSQKGTRACSRLPRVPQFRIVAPFDGKIWISANSEVISCLGINGELVLPAQAQHSGSNTRTLAILALITTTMNAISLQLHPESPGQDAQYAINKVRVSKLIQSFSRVDPFVDDIDGDGVAILLAHDWLVRIYIRAEKLMAVYGRYIIMFRRSDGFAAVEYGFS
ncbi:hypothetical protein BDZ89DRAFT_1043623 [Hymenopellis radicata]|nr:hypothetical protein BDZ89DRAFT_1043623 [Hymenopellis radicata]